MSKVTFHIFATSPEKIKFLLATKHKHFIQFESTTLAVLPRHAQSMENKFTISLQYIKENVKDKVDFLPVDKRLPKSDIILDV